MTGATWKRKIALSILLFFVVFNPPVIRQISFTMLFSALAFADLFLHYGETRAMIRRLRRPGILLLTGFLYYFALCGVQTLRNPDHLQSIFGWFGENLFNTACQFAICLSLIRIAFRWGFDPKDLAKCFLLAAGAQGFLAAACFVSPAVKHLLNETMIENTRSIDFAITIRINSYRRNYGFASTLFDIFGFTMSILAVTAFCKAYNSRGKVWYLFFGAATLAAVLNARTGIVLIGIGVILCVLLSNIRRLSGMDLAKKGLIALALAAAALVVLERIQGSESATASWLSGGIDQIFNLFQGEKTGIFLTMSEQFVFFPANLPEMIFGTAMAPEELIGRYTDMGYIQNIWRYGIVGCVLIYGFWISLLKAAYRNGKDGEDRVLAVCIGAILFIYQLKLNTWGFSMAGMVYYPLLISMALRSREGETETIRERSCLDERKRLAPGHAEHVYL